jgi:MFS family permease
MANRLLVKCARRPYRRRECTKARYGRPALASTAARGDTYRWQLSAFILVAYLLFGAGFMAYTTFAALEPAHISPFVRFFVTGATAIIGSLAAAHVRTPERAMGLALILGAVGAACAIAGLPVGDVFFGIGLTAVPGLATAVLRFRAGATGATQAIALSVIAVGTGQFLGPVLAGGAAQQYGIAWAFGIAGAAYAAGVLLIVVDELVFKRRDTRLPVPGPA